MESLVKLYPELSEDNKETDADSKKSEHDRIIIGGEVYIANPPPTPDKRLKVLEHLKKTNFDMINKMGTLIDLTKKVVKKMRL